MKTEKTTKNVMPDYKKIRELSNRIDCTITRADFNTSRPNPYRIASTANDIHRYLKYVNKEVEL